MVVLAICYYALMQFAQEKYSIVLKDSSLEIVDFSIEDKEELVNEVPPNPLKNHIWDLHVYKIFIWCVFLEWMQPMTHIDTLRVRWSNIH